MDTLTQRIARFTAGLTHEALPEAVREKCKVSLLHNLGVALAGGPLLQAPRRYAQMLGEAGPGASARLLLGGDRASAETAAFVNASLMHARAQDDVYFAGLTHAGAILSPAVLAVAEQLDASGQEVVTALAAGYEAVGAISQDVARLTTPRGFRASGIYGGFGAAAGVARLLGLDATATAHALGLAASSASGTNQTWVSGTQEWQIQIGLAARNGLMAARLAQVGATAAPDALEGPAGFYRAFLGHCDGLAAIGNDLGQHWRCLDVTYKPYAVCAILQAPVAQAIALAQANDIDPGQIAAIRLSLNPAEAAYPGTDARGPFVDIGATLMSAQFCLAVALSQRVVRGVDLQRLNDPALQPLIHCTEVIPDASLATRQFVLDIELRGGSRLRHASQHTGQPFNWDRQGVMDNLRAMSDEIPLPPPRLERLFDTVLHAERHSARDIVSSAIVAA